MPRMPRRFPRSRDVPALRCRSGPPHGRRRARMALPSSGSPGVERRRSRLCAAAGRGGTIAATYARWARAERRKQAVSAGTSGAASDDELFTAHRDEGLILEVCASFFSAARGRRENQSGRGHRLAAFPARLPDPGDERRSGAQPGRRLRPGNRPVPRQDRRSVPASATISPSTKSTFRRRSSATGARSRLT